MRYNVVIRKHKCTRVERRIPCGNIYERALFEEAHLLRDLDPQLWDIDIEEED